MRRFLAGLVLFSSAAVASPTLLELLNDNDRIQPIELMQRIESQFPGVIVEFETDVENGALVYEIDLINPDDRTTTELDLLASNGEILKRKVERLEADDMAELAVVKLLVQKQLSFSQLVEMAVQNSKAHLLEAQLDKDLGIAYLELKVMDERGKHKLAFDIEKQRPLPLLKWD